MWNLIRNWRFWLLDLGLPSPAHCSLQCMSGHWKGASPFSFFRNGCRFSRPFFWSSVLKLKLSVWEQSSPLEAQQDSCLFLLPFLFFFVVVVVVVVPHGMWDLSFQTRNGTHAPTLKTWNHNHWIAREGLLAISETNVWILERNGFWYSHWKIPHNWSTVGKNLLESFDLSIWWKSKLPNMVFILSN